MKKDELSKLIMETATEKVKNEYPDNLGEQNFGSTINVSEAHRVFYALRAGFVRNGVTKNVEGVSPECKNLACASAFALSVVNSLYMTDALSNKIDEFFDDPANKSKLKGYSEEEKTNLRNELKENVKSALEVTGTTPEGKALAEKLKENYYAGPRENEKDADMSIVRLHKYQTGLCAISSLVYQMTYNADAEASLKNVQKYVGESDGFVKILTDAFENESEGLSRETEAIERHINFFDLHDEDVFGRDEEEELQVVDKLTSEDFLKKMKSGENLREDDFIWAQRKFFSLDVSKSYVDYPVFTKYDFSNFHLDGKPMFSSEEHEKLTNNEKIAAVVAKVLEGSEVTYREEGKETLISAKIEPEEEKNWLQRILDYVMDKLGFGNEAAKDKAKEDQKRNDAINKTRENYEKKIRAPITLDELRGFDALKKVTSESRSKKEHTAEKSGPSK